MKALILLAAVTLSACVSSQVTQRGELYDVRVDYGLRSELDLDYTVSQEGDRLCPGGFARVAERPNPPGAPMGRTVTLRCAP